MERQDRPEATHLPILIYDGHCGLCHRAVRYVLERDRQKRFRFAANSSTVGSALLADLGVAVGHPPETMVLVVGPRFFTHSDAALEIERQLGGIHRLVAMAGGLVPRGVRNFLYRRVAANRYRLFGRYDACRLPTASDRAQFLVADEVAT